MFGKVFALKNICRKIFRLKNIKFYGITLGLASFLILLACLIHPAITHGEGALIFLHTTIPAIEGPEAQKIEDNKEYIAENILEEDPEQRLVEMLQKDDFDHAYDRLENKESWQVVRMRVTGYCSCRRCCGKFSDGKTASNHRIRRGDVFVAADKHHRFGTQMIVPGYNNTQSVQVQDRGRVIKGNRLDLYFDTHRRAKKWGVKYLDVLVKTN